MKRNLAYLIFPALLMVLGCSQSFLEVPPLTTITNETFPVTANDAYLVTNAT